MHKNRKTQTTIRQLVLHCLVIVAFFLVIWLLTNDALGQQADLRSSGGTGIFRSQTVVIEHQNTLYRLYRFRRGLSRWGTWEQQKGYVKHNNGHSWWPAKLSPLQLKQVLNPQLSIFLDSKLDSTYYNFTNNPKHDYPRYGTEHYGTYTKKRITFKVRPPL